MEPIRIMQIFHCRQFANTLVQIRGYRAQCLALRTQGAVDWPPAFIAILLSDLDDAVELCESSSFTDALSHARLARRAAKKSIEEVNFSGLEAHLLRIEEAILKDAWLQKFLLVPSTRAEYVESPEALMGADVVKAFPSATSDLREAGNCLAADCNTAAVFHLMRAVEWALRAFAVHLGFRTLKIHKRGRSYKLTPVSFSTWEGILTECESKVDKMITTMRAGKRKQQAQEFYYPVLADIRALKDAWRNHVMHNRAEYSASDADAILDHVKRLMTMLAKRVKEV
jgi:hypothetical protein